MFFVHKVGKSVVMPSTVLEVMTWIDKESIVRISSFQDFYILV